jgi:hypothetical protein
MGIRKLFLSSFLGLLSLQAIAQDKMVSKAPVSAVVNQEYRIALILPFASKRRRKNLSEVMLDYAAGFKMGLKKLEAEGLKCKLYVFDNDKDSAYIDVILKHPDMPKMDLIVGPIYDEDVAKTNAFCAKFGITLVNPLRYFDNKNSNHTMINFFPSDAQQMKAVAKKLVMKYPKHVFYVAKDITVGSENLAKSAREELKLANVTVGNDLVLSNGVLDGKIWRTDSVIVISASLSDEMQDILNTTLMNMPSSFGVAHFDKNKSIKTPKLYGKILFPDLYNYDKSDSTSHQFYTNFYKQQYGAPSKYGSIGYDQSTYLGYSLKAFGKDFIHHLPNATYVGIRNSIFLNETEDGNITNYGMYFFKHFKNLKKLEQ